MRSHDCFRDREIQFYDMASFSPLCQISGLESIPITTDYRSGHGLSSTRPLPVCSSRMGWAGVVHGLKAGTRTFCVYLGIDHL